MSEVKPEKGDFMKRLNWKNLFLVPAVLLTFAASASDWDDSNAVEEVAAPINGIFVPKGFDNNDNAQVVITGAYPNTCYQVGRVDALVNDETKTIDVEVTSFFHSNRPCLMLYTPFTEVVSLGLLKAGSYHVQVNNKADQQLMPVSIAPVDSSDDFVYANVFGLIRKGDRGFVLEGRLPKACAKLQKVQMIEEPGNVVVVLPLVEFPEGCDPNVVNDRDRGQAFSEEIQLPSSMKGRYLIHVRSLNGGSMNQVVEL